MFAIASIDLDWGIGKDGDLLCHVKEDMQFFKDHTIGKTVIMGRKTLESLPGGRPLKDRENVVLTRDRSFSREGVTAVHSVEEVCELAKCRDCAVIGGGSVYEALMPYTDTVYLTLFEKKFGADTFFPKLDEQQWERSILGKGEKNGLKYTFYLFKKTQIKVETT